MSFTKLDISSFGFKTLKVRFDIHTQCRVGNKSQLQLFRVIVKTNTKTRIELLNFHQVSAECMRTPKLSVIMYKLSAFTTRISLVRKHILFHNALYNFTNLFSIIEIKLKLQKGSTNQNAQLQPQPRWTKRDVPVRSANSQLRGSRFSLKFSDSPPKQQNGARPCKSTSR